MVDWRASRDWPVAITSPQLTNRYGFAPSSSQASLIATNISPGFCDKINQWPNVERVDVLGYHTMAMDKWEQLAQAVRFRIHQQPAKN